MSLVFTRQRHLSVDVRAVRSHIPVRSWVRTCTDKEVGVPLQEEVMPRSGCF